MRVAQGSQVRPRHSLPVRDALGHPYRTIVVHVGLVAAGHSETGKGRLGVVEHGGPAAPGIENLALLEPQQGGFPGALGGGVDIESSGDGEVLGGMLVAFVRSGEFFDDSFRGFALKVGQEAAVGDT